MQCHLHGYSLFISPTILNAVLLLSFESFSQLKIFLWAFFAHCPKLHVGVLKTFQTTKILNYIVNPKIYNNFVYSNKIQGAGQMPSKSLIVTLIF